MISLENERYFIWQGWDSREEGIVIAENGVNLRTPSMRNSELNINGSNDVIVNEQGFSSYDVEIKLVYVGDWGIDSTSNFRKMINQLFYKTRPNYEHHKGKLVFSWDSDFYYEAKLLNSIDVVQFEQYKTTTVKFRVQPLKRVYDIANDPVYPYIQNKRSNRQRCYNGDLVPNTITIDVTEDNELGRKPKMFIDYVAPAEGTTNGLLIVKSVSYSGKKGTYVGRQWSINLNKLIREHPEATMLCFDFERDDYYVCKADNTTTAPWEGKNYVTNFTRDSAVCSLVPYMMKVFAYDFIVDDSGAIVQTEQKMWHNISFQSIYDKLTVEMWDNNNQPIQNAEYRYFYAPEVREI